MTHAPRTALAIKFTLAVTVALAVLVPATLSYANPAWNTKISDLTFNAGQLIQRTDTPSIVTTFDTDNLWKSTPSGDRGTTQYKSVSGNCETRLTEGQLPDNLVRVNGDHGTTEAYINAAFPDAKKGTLTNLPTDTTLAYSTVDSGKTVDGLAVNTPIFHAVFRAFTATNSVIVASVVCTDTSEEAKALTHDAFLHVAVVAP
jgi:hypothetical protein